MAVRLNWPVVAGGFLLALICVWVKSAYLSPRWPDYGFTFEFSWLSLASILLLSGAVLAVTPNRLQSPAALAAGVLAFVVVIPTFAITLTQIGGIRYLPLLLTLCLGSAGTLLAARLSETLPTGEAGTVPQWFMSSVLAAWCIGTALLLWNYWQILGFAGIDGTYEQRKLGRSSSPWMSYLQTYYIGVFCPALLAYGLVNKSNWLYAAPAIFGFALIYAITAQKMALACPLLMIAMAVALKLRWNYSANFLWGFVAIAVAGLTSFLLLGSYSVPASILLHRTIGIPALTVSQYYDVFGAFGFTRWSHVRGISSFVNAPSALAEHAMWPQLGYVVGDLALGMPENNTNGNLFASDGAGAMGAAGVVAICLALSVWLALINILSRAWDQSYAILVILPVALSLSNGPFFTVMLSFGGLFWLVAFGAANVARRLARPATKI